MQRAYKTEIRPTPTQAEELARWCGTARWVWNWGLAERIRLYEETSETMGFFDQCQAVVKLKREEETAWLQTAPSSLILAALLDLDRAYKHFFRRVKKGETPGFPRFKAKGRSDPSCRVYGGVHVASKRIKLPKLGWVRLKERRYIPLTVKACKLASGGRIVQVAIRLKAGRWYVSVLVEVEDQPVGPADGPTVAAHPGVREFLTVSDGEAETRFENPQALEFYLRRLRRLQRRLARQEKGSAKRAKTLALIQKLHVRITNLRSDATHKATHTATRDAGAVVVQQWDVKSMLEDEDAEVPRVVRSKKRRRLADANTAEMRRQLEYKARWRGADLVTLPGDMPISKRCSSCGEIHAEFGAEQVFECPACGERMDRETNATKNMLYFAAEILENECGDV